MFWIVGLIIVLAGVSLTLHLREEWEFDKMADELLGDINRAVENEGNND